MPISSCAEVNIAILAYYAKVKKPFKVVLIDHGNIGMQGMGVTLKDPLQDQVGHFLKARYLWSATEELAFINTIKGRVSSVEFCGCNVAKKPAGDSWLHFLADQSRVTFIGYTGDVFWTTEPHVPGQTFSTADGATREVFSPR